MGKPVDPDSYLLAQYTGHVPLPFLQTFVSPAGTKAIREAQGILDAVNNHPKVKPMLHPRLLALSVNCRAPWFKSDPRRMKWLRSEVYNNERCLLDFLGGLPINIFLNLCEADAHIDDTASENQEYLCLKLSKQLRVGPYTSLEAFESLRYQDLAQAVVEGFGIPTSDPRGNELRSSVARGFSVAGRIATHVLAVQQSLPNVCTTVATHYRVRYYLNDDVVEELLSALGGQFWNLNSSDKTDLCALLKCLTRGSAPLLCVHNPTEAAKLDPEQEWLDADLWRLWVLTHGLHPLMHVFETGRPWNTGVLKDMDADWVLLLYKAWPEWYSFRSEFYAWWKDRHVIELLDELQTGDDEFLNKYDVDALNVVNW
ncbi:hypothetical protein EKO04_001698 [Ascochyta lentis]|uniref:Uncharacterized protein n=1 Tax=Ascochyta lentis TaxID=205686 RepID=A0A8H7JBU4_9PLEO|nr:hypothetical protein EKO04_001698 [Ascochyta lentis]